VKGNRGESTVSDGRALKIGVSASQKARYWGCMRVCIWSYRARAMTHRIGDSCFGSFGHIDGISLQEQHQF